MMWSLQIDELGFYEKRVAYSLSFVSWPEVTGNLQLQSGEDKKTKESVKWL